MHQYIHQVKSISVTKPEKLENTGTYERTISIHTEEGTIRLTIFSKHAANMVIGCE